MTARGTVTVKHMNILVTNDDGVTSEGIKTLQKELSEDHDVWVLAPESDRSGSSHCITLNGPVKIKQHDERVFSASGTPVDCVLLSMLGALPVTPDAVISGINLGPNLGSDITFSGTTAGARQGTIMKRPSIAVSLGSYTPPFHCATAARFVRNNLDTLISLWDKNHFININVPNVEAVPEKVEITTLSNPRYESTLHSFTSPKGEGFYFFRGFPKEIQPEPGTDMHAVLHGNISISPIFLLPVLYDHEGKYRPELFR